MATSRAGEFLFQGLTGLGQGIEKRASRLEQQEKDLKRARATQKFMEANAEQLGINPESLQGYGAEDYNMIAPLIMKGSEMGLRARELEANISAKKAEADLMNAKQQAILSDQVGTETYLSNVASGNIISDNPSINSLASLYSQGVPVSTEMLQKASESPASSSSLVRIDTGPGMTKQVLFNKNTKTFEDVGFPEVPKTNPGTLSTDDYIARERELDPLAFNNEILKTAAGSANIVKKLNQMETLLDEGLETGAFTEQLAAVSKFAKRAFGIDIDPKTRDRAGLFKSLQLDVAQDKFFSRAKGAISDTETKLFLGAVGSLGETPEGNKRIINFLKAAEQKNVDLAKQIKDWRKEGLKPSEIQEEIINWRESPKNDISVILTGDGAGADNQSKAPSTPSTMNEISPGQQITVPTASGGSVTGVVSDDGSSLTLPDGRVLMLKEQ